MLRRNPTVTILVLTSLLLAAGPLVAQDWAGSGRAAGRIVDEKGKPIAGATIRLRQDPSDEASGPPAFETDKKGRWSYLGLDVGPWTVFIDAEGYLPSEGTLTVNPFAASTPLTIELQRSLSASIAAGDVLLDAADFTGARAKYVEAMAGLDVTAQARLNTRIADTYFGEENYVTARSHYQKALAGLGPGEQGHTLYQLGKTYEKTGDIAAARVEYQKAMPLVSQDMQLRLLLEIAAGHDLEGKRSAAIETLRGGLETFPGNESMIRVIADLLTREGREEEARQYLAQLPEGASLPADMLLNIGIRLYNEGKTTEANDYFGQAVEDNPDLATAYYYRGLTYLAMEENSQAAADFKRLLELEPDNEHASEARDFLEFLEPGE